MKIGIIGYGSIGKRHAENFFSHGKNRDVLIYDPDPKSGAEHSLIGVAKDFASLASEADAFVIASPSEKHSMQIHEITRQSSAPILVEKPIATSRRQMNDLAALDRIMVGYNLRFLRSVQKTKEILDEGRIRPLWARFTCAQYNDRPEYLRDGVILNWSHEIDLALYLMGPAKMKASNTVLKNGQDVLTDITLEHDSGVTSTIHLDYLKKPQVRGFSVIGEESNIMCDLADGMFMHEKPWSKDMLMEGEFDDCYVREMGQFIKFCETGDLGAGCSAQEALQVLDICLQVRQQAGLEV